MHIKWKELLKQELESENFIEIKKFLTKEINMGKEIYPKQEDIFNAYTDPDNLKVVILGQDPYHGPNQAHGLSFSVRKGVKPPPSLMNIYKEIEMETNTKIDKTNGDLSNWQEQGVMLLNAFLSVERGLPGSHQKIGWEQFTDQTIKKISENKSNIVFILWGAFAQKKESLIDSTKHLILKSPHPSPFSAHNGFFGNNHFIKANDYLTQHNIPPIEWTSI